MINILEEINTASPPTHTFLYHYVFIIARMYLVVIFYSWLPCLLTFANLFSERTPPLLIFIRSWLIVYFFSNAR